MDLFETILTKATIHAPGGLIFIGDELADRGNNDWFTLLVMKKLDDSKVPFTIQLSNHSVIALLSFESNWCDPQLVKKGQQRSLTNLYELFRRGLITPVQLNNILPKAYKEHLSLISYIKTEENRVIERLVKEI